MQRIKLIIGFVFLFVVVVLLVIKLQADTYLCVAARYDGDEKTTINLEVVDYRYWFEFTDTAEIESDLLQENYVNKQKLMISTTKEADYYSAEINGVMHFAVRNHHTKQNYYIGNCRLKP
ncbi:TPA: hypothetical protein OF688_001737 [Escherichia coli]|nr:hypothetical protein [Escherichia coli]